MSRSPKTKAPDTRNFAFVVVFRGGVRVEWARDRENDPEGDCNITWQAATLEGMPSQSGAGVVVQSVTLEPS